MFRIACPTCNRKSSKKFEYCPYCGNSFRGSSRNEGFGLLGQEDSGNLQEEIKLPFGMEKMINALAKQLEKQMGAMNFEEMASNTQGQGTPKGFKINVSMGRPGDGQFVQEMTPSIPIDGEISRKETDKRNSLPRVDAESSMKRLADRIVYEIITPGVKSKKDVAVAELATGLEVKAYSRNKCYVKFIPLKVEVIGYYLKNERLFLELKV
jgi:hypothetical protein|tara:strand:- start:455 stop:1084 length:630 start_codon:yes stop_codon:yes gene_type:complete